MPEEVFKVIDVIAVFQILIFTVILSRQKKIQFTSKVFLIIFLISLGLCLADRIQFFYRNILNYYNFPHFYNLGDTFHLLYIPALYFYYKSFTTANFKIKWKYLWHVVPAVLIFLNLLVNYYLKPAEVKFARLHYGMPFYTKNYQLIIIEAFHLLQTTYFIIMLYLVRTYHKQIKGSYTNFNDFQITVLYLIPSVPLFIRLLQYSFIFLNTDIKIHIDFILVFYTVLVVYLGYRQPKIFLHPLDLKKIEYENISLKALRERLMQLMKTEKIYQKPNITLTDLALQLDVSPRILSTLLNTQLKLSFFNFINNLRIEEAKKMLSEKSNDKTVLEILYEVGFNNKSAFNRVFKEKTGLTPTQYRKQSIQ